MATCRALAAIAFLGFLSLEVVRADDCHPQLDPAKPQYIIGYGSLMQAASKRMTDPDAGMNRPVLVTGFQRGWSLHGTFYNTYLGVQPSAPARMVAALYRDFLEDGELASDAREISYCRAPVEPHSIEMLDGTSVPTPGQIWIYVNKPEKVGAPNEDYPIVQSYVDIFLSGCIELQQRVSDPDLDFLEQCVLTTGGWSRHWVNDRIYPRRPYQYQRHAFEIDRVLRKLMPEIVEAIRIE